MASTKPDAWGGPAFPTWLEAHPDLRLGSFADTAVAAELVVNATNGARSVEALTLAGSEEPGRQGAGGRLQPARLLARDAADAAGEGHRFAGRADPAGVPGCPSGEDAQHDDREVKATRRYSRRRARRVREWQRRGGQDEGDDAAAKPRALRVIDLGDITTARGAEMYLPLGCDPRNPRHRDAQHQGGALTAIAAVCRHRPGPGHERGRGVTTSLGAWPNAAAPATGRP